MTSILFLMLLLLLYYKNRPMALSWLSYTHCEYFKCNAVPLMLMMMMMICSHAKQVCLTNSERTIENVKIHLKSRVIHSIIYLLCNCHSIEYQNRQNGTEIDAVFIDNCGGNWVICFSARDENQLQKIRRWGKSAFYE